MAIKDIFKVSFKTFFNPGAWLDINNLSIISRDTWKSVRNLFVAPETVQKESFQAAAERLKLTEQDLIERQQRFLMFAYSFFALAALMFIFSFYLLLIHSTFSGFCLGLAVSALFMTQAFRFHFWYFQTKHRKLGCTLQEWWEDKLLNEPSGPKP